jgi:hypothetical protein
VERALLKSLAVAVVVLGSGGSYACRKTPAPPAEAKPAPPGSCIKEVLVGGENLCFLVTAGYWICRGDVNALGDGEMLGAPPELRDRQRHEWIAQPKRFVDMQLGERGACGLDAEQRVWCWGDSGYWGDRTNKGVPIEQTGLGLADEFAFGWGLCARRGDTITCRGVQNENVTEIRGLPPGIRHLGASLDFAAPRPTTTCIAGVARRGRTTTSRGFASRRGRNVQRELQKIEDLAERQLQDHASTTLESLPLLAKLPILLEEIA